jgi:uncharacterized protein
VRRLFPAILLALLLTVIAGTALVSAQTFPEVTGYVNDYAGLITPQGKAQLETKLAQLEKDTTTQVFVATIKSLEGDTVEDYAVRLFEKWKIGQKDKNNGVLLLVALDDHKVRIEVGYGLEPIITDGRAGRIRDSEILPRFKANDYEGGITAGVNAIEQYIRTGTPPAPLEENPVKSMFGGFEMAFFILTFITVYMFGFMARSKSIWLGGVWGAVAGIILGLTIGGIAALIATPLIFMGLGLLTDFLLSRNYQKMTAAGQSADWHKSWGGFWGGGGGFGGGDGGLGGGVGGGGGGMSGGGGASGSW